MRAAFQILKCVEMWMEQHPRVMTGHWKSKQWTHLMRRTKKTVWGRNEVLRLIGWGLYRSAVNDLISLYINDSGITECFQPGGGCLKEFRHHKVVSYSKRCLYWVCLMLINNAFCSENSPVCKLVYSIKHVVFFFFWKRQGSLSFWCISC